MSLKRTLVQIMDRPGGRTLLGRVATRVARRHTGSDIELFYAGGIWTHRVGPYCFPDGPRFNYYENDLKPMEGQANEYFSIADEFWFRHFRPQEGDVVIDVGAGRGEDTLAFSRAIGAAGRVFAIEAHPFSFEILKQFCHLNRLTNATVLHLALMDKPGTVSMVESCAWQGHSVSIGHVPTEVQVRAATLDEVCEKQGIKEIDFLKMNIEGAERPAIIGMAASLRHIRAICVSCHDFRADSGGGEHFRTRDFVKGFLADHEFEVISNLEDPRPPVRDLVYGIRRK